MRIAIATTTGFHLVHLARELINLGHDVKYYSYHPSSRIKKDGIPLEKFSSLFLSTQPWASGALFRYIPKLQKRCVEKMLAITDESIASRLEPCDIFIGLSAMACKSAELARKKFNAKVIIDRGSMHVKTHRALIEIDGSSRMSKGYLERELCSYEVADYITIPSLNSFLSFINNGHQAQNLFLNHYGVNLKRFHPTPKPEGPFTLVFVGSWTFTKGVDTLNLALEIIPDIKVIHAGTTPNSEIPHHKCIQTLGHVNNDELVKIYSRAHALVLPSRQDGFGMVMLEALACGLPVIASDKTGGPDIQEVIENKDNLEIFTAGCVESLVKAIKKIRMRVESTPKQLERCALSKKDINYFSWQAYAQRYAKFITSIL